MRDRHVWRRHHHVVVRYRRRTDFGFPDWPHQWVRVIQHGYGYYTSSTTDPLSGEIDVRLLTLTESGEIAHTAQLSALFLPLFDLELLDAYWVMRTMDGNYIAFLTAYNMDTNDLSRKFAVSKFTPDGQIIWLRELKLFEGYFANFYLNELPDSSIALTGDWRIGANGIPKLFFIKIGADGEASPNHLSGVVALDDNENCLFDSTEIRLPGWLLRVENDADQWITQTDTAGRYVAAAGAGDYTLSLLTPNYLWEACDNPRTVTLSTDTLNTEHLSDFSVAPLAICPYMQVEILAPALQSGIENQYVLKYCNAGTALATGATASVEADDLLTLVDASKPYTLADGIIHFDLGNVDIGTCGQIVLHFLAPEAPDLIGQSLCVTARVTPDVVCATGQSPQWSGAILEASALCDGDSIRFEIKNIGTGQSAANLDYIIADDHVIMFSDQLPALQPGVSQQVAVAANGHSWRIEVEQEPFVPEQRRPSLPVEGCAGAGTATSLGLATQLPNNTGSPFSDTECRNITGTSIQPLVQLSANPTGIPPLNLIPQETKIDYMVVFNPVNPATTILIADTLATELDMATFVPGPSSNPYTWHIGSNGVLYMVFNADSMLLESGFVQFSATTRPGLDTGTVVLNRAAMSVDGGPAVSTNMVFHTIGTTITTGVFDLQNDLDLQQLHILPNPASAHALVQIPVAVQPGQSLTLRNALGQTVWQGDVHASVITLPRNGMPNGWYVLELHERGRLLARGQLVFCN
ncbi:MAG: hypothetical protein IT262_01320 [Saprospiraceae bacterium]|nr:hypothetical protein [Saprospiraceae bacterium]